MGDYDDDERLAFEDQLYQDDGSGSASDASGDDEHELAQINYNHSFTLDAAVKSEEEEEEEEQGEPGNLLTDDVTAFSLKRGEDEEGSEDMEISENDMPVVISSSDDDSEESEPSVEETLKSPDTLRVVQMRTVAPTEPGIELKELFKDSPETRRKVSSVTIRMVSGVSSNGASHKFLPGKGDPMLSVQSRPQSRLVPAQLSLLQLYAPGPPVKSVPKSEKHCSMPALRQHPWSTTTPFNAMPAPLEAVQIQQQGDFGPTIYLLLHVRRRGSLWRRLSRSAVEPSCAPRIGF
ncbi:hypothetical protein HDU89_008093 [Geranomyces variabilis]|nr:hypothetical protein HDU89_008093 [Geranomyces variabilis]